MKQLAVILFGISYYEKYNHRDGETYDIDYMNSYANYKQFIFDYFLKKGYNCDVYYVTNIHDMKTNLEKDYNPIKCLYQDNNEVNKHYCKNNKLVKAIDLCLKQNLIYDHCLITRFDLLFKDNFDNINYDKLNLISILEHPSLICDNFYFMPYSLLAKFFTVCSKNIEI